jgi:hypothetical protein
MLPALLLAVLAVQEAVPEAGLARMPVREVTIFKDGHAFVLQEGELAVDARGNVLLDQLPRPVMGTFWAYSADPRAPLSAVVVGRRRVRVERTALTLPDLVAANVGAAVTVVETDGDRYDATIAEIPSGDWAGLEEPAVPPRGQLVLLETAGGLKVAPLADIREVTFRGKHRPKLATEEYRELMTLQLDGERAAGAKARVGMAYLQKGLRWIPSYRVSIDGQGRATLKLQATLINELTDLEKVKAHLVIGVPSFAFEETLDPVALSQAAAQLSAHFRQDAQTAYAFSNAVMTQMARMGEYRHAEAAAPAAGGGPDLPAGKNEDLFIFTVEGITLKRGERLVLPVAEFAIPYRDVYTLRIAMIPPPEVRQHFNGEQQKELARLFHRPKVMHQIRLQNSSAYPLTTAPALILKEGRLIGQGMMTYTSVGCTGDLELTAAVDIPADKDEEETRRTPGAMQWHGTTFDRIDLAGTVTLTNRRGTPVEVEVVRYVLGEAHDATAGGAVQKVNLYEEDGSAGGPGGRWAWYAWPYAYSHVNPISKVTWTVKLEAGKSAELGYGWHYFTR